MSEFYLFFRSGIEFITDLNNFQNIAFLISLFAIYQIKNWSNILILLTAFALGHCISLLFISIDIFNVSKDRINIFISLMILSSALINLYQKSDKFRSGIFKIKYLITVLFALFQSAGVYNGFKYIMPEGKKSLVPFISYNIGIEAGQIILILTLLVLCILMVDILKVRYREWILVLTGISIGASLILLLEYFP